MSEQNPALSLELHGVEQAPLGGGVAQLTLRTDAGEIVGRLHPAAPGEGAVLWVGGAGGGLDGPANGLYPRLAAQLAPDQVASLRLHYRLPNHLDACVLDTLMGVAYLGTLGHARVALVGHSFGGAVVISAGAASPAVVGVAALSSQTYGTTAVVDLSPRPLLLMHGIDDEVLPDSCSRDLYQRAHEPKQLLLYPGCHHGLEECQAELDRDLLAWLRQVALATR
ncbi:MAG: alpha/beta hydrolase [Kouleothrix sp.]|nr:alpha/beta hydrolase [Kouleothrix sp.]